MTTRVIPTDLDKPLPFYKTVSSDVLAGITGAIAGAPQSMAFAIIAGVNPVYGLYGAIVGTIVAALVGSSAFMTVAPTNALALIIASTTIQFESGDPLQRMMVITLLAGVFQLIFGLLKLGELTRYVSNAVMTGFVTGGSMLVILGQLAEVTGFEGKLQGSLVLVRSFDWLTHLDHINPQATLIGIAALAIIYGLHHTRFKNIATLAAIVLTMGFLEFSGWQIPLVGDKSEVPQGLPTPVLPHLEYIPDLWNVALALAVLGLAQSAGITRSVPQPDGSAADTSRDFVGQGLANIANGFFQGMPAGGSFGRTAVNLSSGAKTRWANVYAALFIGLILLVFGNGIERIPLATLAAHLMIAGSSLISPQQIRMVWQIDTAARLSMGATFLAAMLMPLEYSIYIGVGLSLALYAYNSSSSLHLRQLIPLPDGNFREVEPPHTLPSHEPIILTIYGNLYFAAVTTLEQQLPNPSRAEMPVVILRLKGNDFMGSTGIRLLEQYQTKLTQRGGKLILTGIGVKVAGQLQRTGAWTRIGKENIFLENEILLASTRAGLAAARQWIKDQTTSLDAVEV